MRAIFVVLLVLGVSLGWVSCKTVSSYSQDTAPVHAGKLRKKQRRQLISYAAGFTGVPYKWGGSTPAGFDCSGFTCYCFSRFGMQLPRTAAEQATVGKRIRSRRARPGDLIFFEGADRKPRKTGHVGIVVSGKKKAIRFIHAGSKGITISGLSEDYFSKRFRTIRRVKRTS